MIAPITELHPERAVVEREGATLVVRIPMTIRKRGGRKEIFVPAGLDDGCAPRAAPQEPLVLALARAFEWQELLDAGRYPSITELADALGVDRSYVGRILRLATLAPDLVAAIVRGEEPSGLSLERLVKRLPMAWEAQRALFTAAGRDAGSPRRDEARAFEPGVPGHSNGYPKSP